MAQKKSTAKTTKTTASKKTTTAKAPTPKPIRREVAGGVCFVLGFIALLGLFPFAEGAFVIDILCLYVWKGLYGWGFYVTAICFFWASWILIFHRGRPILARVICVMLVPVFFGAIVHLFSDDNGFYLGIDHIVLLYQGGKNTESGGVIGGLLAELLNSALSKPGAMIVLIVGMVAVVFVGAKVSVKKTFEDIKNHQFPPYEPEPEPEPAPAPMPLPRARQTARTESFPIDIPIEDGKDKKKGKSRPAPEKKKKRSWIDIDIDEDEFDEPAPPAAPAAETIPDMPRGYEEYRNRRKSGRTAVLDLK